MQRKEPHIIHLQEFENLVRDCQRLLGDGVYNTCFERLGAYLEHHGSQPNKHELVMHQSEHSDIQKEKRRDIVPLEDLNRRRRKLNFALLDFISSLKPLDYLNYAEGSLRRRTKWDERENLTVCLQFDSDFSHLDKLFKSFNGDATWNQLVQIKRYFVNEEGEEIILEEGFEEEILPLGVGSGETIFLPEDFPDGDFQEQQDLSNQNQVLPSHNNLEEQEDAKDEVQPSVEIKEDLWKDENALRIKKKYQKTILMIDDFGKEKMELVEESAWAIIEKVEIRFQICISLVGVSEWKCFLATELLEWFEKHELFANGSSERFTVCIPQAVGFRASESSLTEVSIFMKQPV